jgi:AraC-like DNA-binding protein
MLAVIPWGGSAATVPYHQAEAFMKIDSRGTYTRKRCADREIALIRHCDRGGELEFMISISNIIRRLLGEGSLDIEHTAQFIGMTRRTLQRRLAESGTEYSRLVDEVRLARAAALIHNSSTNLADVAQELGYSDPANFARAFRRWTGLSPSSFKRMDRRSRDLFVKAKLRSVSGEKARP